MIFKIDEITIAADRRRIDEAKVRELAASIQKVGLLNPITVTPEKKLIAGEHRLEAVKLLGLTEIEVTILKGDELLQQLAEIDENLVRNELAECELRTKLLNIEDLWIQIKLCQKHDLLRLLRKYRLRQIEYGSCICCPLTPHERESLTKRRNELLTKLDSRQDVK